MSFKKMETNFSFADISLFSSMERNRAIKRMQQINAIVDWDRIETLLLRNYPVGKSAEGNDAFRARFPRMIRNAIDALFRRMAFNLLRGTKVIKPAEERGMLSNNRGAVKTAQKVTLYGGKVNSS